MSGEVWPSGSDRLIWDRQNHRFPSSDAHIPRIGLRSSHKVLWTPGTRALRERRYPQYTRYSSGPEDEKARGPSVPPRPLSLFSHRKPAPRYWFLTISKDNQKRFCLQGILYATPPDPCLLRGSECWRGSHIVTTVPIRGLLWTSILPP